MAQGPAILFNINSGGMADSAAELNGIRLQNGIARNGTINGLKQFSATGNNVTCVTFGCHVGPLVTPTTPPLPPTTTTPLLPLCVPSPPRRCRSEPGTRQPDPTCIAAPPTDDGSVYDDDDSGHAYTTDGVRICTARTTTHATCTVRQRPTRMAATTTTPTYGTHDGHKDDNDDTHGGHDDDTTRTTTRRTRTATRTTRTAATTTTPSTPPTYATHDGRKDDNDDTPSGHDDDT
ncbi:hypothetical protein CVT25_000234 [Psilocybe cyanescens]|uniref:Uncharacterized protein n=1 Tax=Psilocybe cyanescens TaxID=93625 RepID=A0A409XW69_PSICY|nr:hypothetical protein CVT25_000234 [Psilocybe cyanescens]